jgi:hypothetical protein
VKLLKKTCLIFTSLLVVALSLNFTKSFGASNSFQSKSIEYRLAAIDSDDVVDDFDGTEFEILYELPLQLFVQIHSNSQKITSNSSEVTSPIPFYLQVRNLRI